MSDSADGAGFAGFVPVRKGVHRLPFLVDGQQVLVAVDADGECVDHRKASSDAELRAAKRNLYEGLMDSGGRNLYAV